MLLLLFFKIRSIVIIGVIRNREKGGLFVRDFVGMRLLVFELGRWGKGIGGGGLGVIDWNGGYGWLRGWLRRMVCWLGLKLGL